jgi:hypothetical protein
MLLPIWPTTSADESDSAGSPGPAESPASPSGALDFSGTHAQHARGPVVYALARFLAQRSKAGVADQASDRSGAQDGIPHREIIVWGRSHVESQDRTAHWASVRE